MKNKLFLLIKYVSKVFNYSRKDSANLLLEVFLRYKVFSLDEVHQKTIIENLITYFQSLVFGVDNLGLNKNTRNKHISNNEVLEHLNSKVENLVINSKYIKIY